MADRRQATAHVTTHERPLGGYEPPDGTFSVGVVDHRGRGCIAVYPLEEATPLFEQVNGLPANYHTRAQATAKALRKYLKRHREQDAKALALAALSTAIASPYCDFATKFSTTVRKLNRAAVSLVFGEKRGLVLVVAERGYDDAGLLKEATRLGLGPLSIFPAGNEEGLQ